MKTKKGLWAYCPKTGLFGWIQIGSIITSFYAKTDKFSCGYYYAQYPAFYSITDSHIDWLNLQIFTEVSDE